jgi:hypothetical protein
VLPSLRVPARSDAMRRAQTNNVDEMLMRKKNWPELTALTSYFFVELPGIETDALPGILDSEQQFRYASFPFSPLVTSGYVFGS